MKVQLIMDILKMTQCMQKSYAENREMNLEFMVGDLVFLKISTMNGVMRFGKKWKLSPRYIRPYNILKSIERVIFEMKLPIGLDTMHLMFHVLMLKKCVGDLVSILYLEVLGFDANLYY